MKGDIHAVNGITVLAAASFSLSEYFRGWDFWPLLFFVIGMALMIVEMITPGLGVPGIFGALSLIAAIIIQARSFTDALLSLLIIMVVLGICALIIFRSFSKGRISRSPIVLNDEAPAKVKNDTLLSLVGKSGVAVNDLRPSGFVDIDGGRYDVVTRGDFIKKGDTVTVSAIEGTKIIVTNTVTEQ